MPQEKSAGAIIYRIENGVPHYLLLHYPSINRKGGHWEFAKGHIEEGETEEETVMREVFEETGIKDLKILPGFKEYIKYFFKAYTKNVAGEDKFKNLSASNQGKPDWIFKLVVFFIAETQTKGVKISKEHIGFDWLPLEDAVKKITYKNSKELLEKVNNFIILQ